MSGNKKIRVCLAASSGGHLMQLLKLRDSWLEYDCFYVASLDVVAKKLSKYGRTYIVGECNRQHPIRTLQVLIQCFRVVLKEKPDVAISTGAAPGLLLCIAAKLFGSKIVWIDSIANVERLSLSGRMVRPFADLLLTQWPELTEKYKNIEYAGTVI